MKQKFKLGQKVIVNSGGADYVAHIDLPIKNKNGYKWETPGSKYWPSETLYLCRFTEDPNRLLCNGAITREQAINEEKQGHFVVNNSQYIPEKYIRPA